MANTSQGKIRIMQGNLQHCKLAMQNVSEYFSEDKVDIALIQEPYVYKSRIRGLNRLRGTIFSNTVSKKPRTCIFIKSNPNYSAVSLPQFCDQDMTTVRLDYRIGDRTMTRILTSVYLPYEELNPPSPIPQELVEFGKREKKEIIFGCDSNAHHTIWGSSNINPRGKSLCEYLSSTDLIILNKGNKPTFVNRVRKEVIDVTLATQSAAREIAEWKVSNEVTFSDHRWITFDLTADNPQRNEFRNPRRTNWEKFRITLGESMDLNPGDIATREDVDNACECISGKIIQAYELSCPLSKPAPGGGEPKWSLELTKLKREARRTFNVAYNSKPGVESEVAWEKHYEAKRKFKKAVRDRDRKSWKDFTSEVKPCKPMAKLKRALAKDPFQPETICTDNGNPTATSGEALEVLLKKHFPGIKNKVSENEIDTGHQKKAQSKKPTVMDWNKAKKLITADRVRWASKSFKPFKSPGADQILPVFIQESIEVLLPHLINIFQASLAFKYIPKAWRDVKVVFIPKPGKLSYANADSYRPISLTSFMLKMLERIIDRYIRDVPLKKKPLHSKQHAYIAGKSVDSAIHNVVWKIEKALNGKQQALGCFIDIVGAFNMICYLIDKKCSYTVQC